ncbi:wsv029 [White spot syndrome virus]|uniref:Wsv029 n=4 Tax=White spot syndrome virus TaxID=342409 RepID=Q8VBD6_WSSVS|nr:wsv029 [Shrimp white spot syndrome virus]AFX59406.1 wsv029 [White spot syndrome virus]AAL33033.1 wsv029 [Shrimp white spot syndrome virus]AAL88953.1 WSSV085 [Shrimp white spot syndrome virus]AWQ60219.1 wsv029 [Shrimp white spot syndrome virus]AWQ60638.1 wsv029 [Shrimp white spot syndrome virus]
MKTHSGFFLTFKKLASIMLFILISQRPSYLSSLAMIALTLKNISYIILDSFLGEKSWFWNCLKLMKPRDNFLAKPRR